MIPAHDLYNRHAFLNWQLNVMVVTDAFSNKRPVLNRQSGSSLRVLQRLLNSVAVGSGGGVLQAQARMSLADGCQRGRCSHGLHRQAASQTNGTSGNSLSCLPFSTMSFNIFSISSSISVEALALPGMLSSRNPVSTRSRSMSYSTRLKEMSITTSSVFLALDVLVVELDPYLLDNAVQSDACLGHGSLIKDSLMIAGIKSRWPF